MIIDYLGVNVVNCSYPKVLPSFLSLFAPNLVAMTRFRSCSNKS